MGLISRVSSRTYRNTFQLDFIKMGRRRSKRKPPPKRKMVEDLETVFTCPFCNSEKSCNVILEIDHKVGRIECSLCGEDFKTSINYLTEPLDVYSEWIDACEAANDGNAVIEDSHHMTAGISVGGAGGMGHDDDDDDSDD